MPQRRGLEEDSPVEGLTWVPCPGRTVSMPIRERAPTASHTFLMVVGILLLLC
jgi:hypothetical protein